MNIEAERSLLIKRIKQVDDSSLIKAIKHMLDYASERGGERISIEQYNRELDEADAEIDAGDYLTHEEALKEIRSWREK